MPYTKNARLTERPLSRVHEHSKILMSEAVCTGVRVGDVGRVKRKRGVELDLTFNREVMEMLQRL